MRHEATGFTDRTKVRHGRRSGEQRHTGFFLGRAPRVGSRRHVTYRRLVFELLREQLLVPPMMTNDLGWTKGYFEFVEHRELSPLNLLPQHCFKDSDGRYFDEKSNRLRAPVEPVGQWGLQSFRTIDDDISKAIGIALVLDERADLA